MVEGDSLLYNVYQRAWSSNPKKRVPDQRRRGKALAEFLLAPENPAT